MMIEPPRRQERHVKNFKSNESQTHFPKANTTQTLAFLASWRLKNLYHESNQTSTQALRDGGI